MFPYAIISLVISSRTTIIYHYLIALIGFVLLLFLTLPAFINEHLLDLLLFLTLSIFVKRAGFRVAPTMRVTHSLVGVVDVAAVMVFGAAGGGWVAGLSNGLYALGSAWHYRNVTASKAVELAAFRFGIKALAAGVSAFVYIGLGGKIPPALLSAVELLPMLALCVVWFMLDHLAWIVGEWLAVGRAGAWAFVRVIMQMSLLVELLPLPLSALVAYLFTTVDRPSFLLVAMGMSLTSIVVRQLSDVSQAYRKRQTELETLNEFGREVGAARLDEQQIIELVYAYASRIADTSNFAISLIDASTQQVDLRLWYQHGERQAPCCYALGGISQWVADHRRALLARDFHKESLPQRSMVLTTERTRSALFVPMLAKEQAIGVISFNSDAPAQFTPDHERVFSAMANQAAVAIEQARLYAAQQRRATQLATIAEVSQRVAGIYELDELLEFVVTLIKVKFGYYHVDIYWLDGACLVYGAGTQTTKSAAENRFDFRAGISLLGTVAQTGEALMVNDVTQEPRYRFDPAAPRTAAELIVPLKVEGKLLGVMEVQADKPHAFSAADMFVMQSLGNQVAVAIHQANLFSDVQQEAYISNALLQVADALGSLTNIEEILQTMVRLTPLLVGAEKCLVLLWDGRESQLMGSASYGLSLESAQQFQNCAYHINQVFGHANAHAHTGFEVHSQYVTLPTELATQWQMAQALTLPLMVRGVLLGVFCVDADTQRDARRVQLLTGIANQAALAIEAAQLETERDKRAQIEQELSIGRAIQSSLLPDCVPQIEGFEVAAVWQPALQVSGDFYDFLPLQENRWGITVADVADKGVPAAIYMTLARTIIRAIGLGKATRRTPHQVLERANEIILSDARTDLFVTVFYAALDPATRTLHYTSAGHNPPLVLRYEKHEVEWLSGRGMALGVQATIALEEHAIQLEAGDVVVMYTDGVTEATNAELDFFGRERLQAAALSAHHDNAAAVLKQILDAIRDFVGRYEQHDDLTIVVLRCK